MLLRVASAALCLTLAPFASAQSPQGSSSARPLITETIDQGSLVPLQGHVRPDLTPGRDLGPVDDSLPLRLYLVLTPSPERIAARDQFIARQQQPGAPEYHHWLTPQQYGERFGVAQADIGKITHWLQSQGFEVKSVLNNASMIDFATTAGGVRNTFHTQLHYWNIQNGKFTANAENPMIPAALANIVTGITGLSKVPVQSKHTPFKPTAYDAETHRWHAPSALPEPASKFSAGSGFYNVTPQDFYTIYDLNKVFATGDRGAGATIALPEPTDMKYGTVNSSTGAATGGDVATFRKLFGVAGTLNMTVLHGAGTVTCADPGINGDEDEATLDAEWANAVAPSAHLIFMSCDDSAAADGFTTALTALIDNNLADVISSSYGRSELYLSPSDYSLDDTLASQAAAQGQSFIDAAGDAGAADADQNNAYTAGSGFNVDQYAGHPLVTAVGGTDFSDKYDADLGGEPQTHYWGTNSLFFGDALGYIPETPWNSSCASSIIAFDTGNVTPAQYCGQGPSVNSYINGAIVGGGGGYSAHYRTPPYQIGIPGLSKAATKRAVPDISFFAANGFWGHALIVCDSNDPTTACTSPSTFGASGGTSFTAPQFAGVTALLVTLTGERQGTLNPGIYALAKAQFAASATAAACYANGQTANIGVTKALPAAACIFHDITTGNNDEPCAKGSLDCYVSPGDQYGLLSTTGASTLTVGYPAAPDYDLATGLGSLDIYNFITHWSQSYASATTFTALPASITASQSTTLKVSVKIGVPSGFTGPDPALTGLVTFSLGSTAIGHCTLVSGTCSASVSASLLKSGANAVTAAYSGNSTYPASTSTAETVSVTTVAPVKLAVLTAPTPGSALTSAGVTFAWQSNGITTFQLSIGTAVGSNNLYDSGPTASTAEYVTGLPLTGQTVYVRLFSKVGSGYQSLDYTFTSEKAVPAALTAPTPGSTLTSGRATFSWNTGKGVSAFELKVGTSLGANNLYDSGSTLSTAHYIDDLPVTGAKVYVRLLSEIGTAWVYTDYTFTSDKAIPAALVTPTPGSTLSSAGVTFSWTTGHDVINFEFKVGTTLGGNDLYESGQTDSTAAYVNDTPLNGKTVYVRLFSRVANSYPYIDYTYKTK